MKTCAWWLWITWFVGACAMSPDERGHEAAAPRESRILLPDGTALSATEVGEGPLVIVLHGGPSLGHRYLVDGLRALGASYRLLFYDQRGAGRSTNESEEGFGLEQLLEDLAEIVEQADERGVVLVGHSWGAYLAMSFAQRGPPALRGLALISPSEPGERFAGQQARRLQAHTTEADSIELAALFRSKAFEHGSEDAMDRLFQVMYRPWFGHREAADDLEAGLTRAQVERARAMGAMVSAAGQGGATWDGLRGIEVPVLILQGDEDVVPVEVGRALADSIPDVRLEILPGVGHFPMLEAPRKERELLSGFLNGLGW